MASLAGRPWVLTSLSDWECGPMTAGCSRPYGEQQAKYLKEDDVKRYLAIAATVLILGAIAAGCNGGGGLSAKEYFNKLEAIAKETQEKESAAQPSEEDSAGLTPDQVKEQGTKFLDSSAAINEDALTKVKELDPPGDLQKAHDRLVAAESDMAKRFRGFADEVRDIPPEDIEDFFNSQVFVESTFAEFDAACSALQDLADGKNIDVDLNCEPEG